MQPILSIFQTITIDTMLNKNRPFYKRRWVWTDRPGFIHTWRLPELYRKGIGSECFCGFSLKSGKRDHCTTKKWRTISAKPRGVYMYKFSIWVHPGVVQYDSHFQKFKRPLLILHLDKDTMIIYGKLKWIHWEQTSALSTWIWIKYPKRMQIVSIFIRSAGGRRAKQRVHQNATLQTQTLGE